MHWGAKVDSARTSNGATALHAASAAGHSTIVDRLLAANADRHLATTDRPWHAWSGGRPHEESRLGGTTPLFMAAAAGHEAVVKSLLAAEPRVAASGLSSVPSDEMPVALSAAWQTSSEDVVDLLLSTGGAHVLVTADLGDKPHAQDSGWSTQDRRVPK